MTAIPYANGSATIQQAKTGKLFKIDASALHWTSESGEERPMGPEHVHSAAVDHPDLGLLTWTVWEYPVGALNARETDVGSHSVVNDLDYGLQH